MRALRHGEFDVLVGINLLREGLDMPEVALVAVLDADKEGFLRSEQSLIQTIGRAARNLNGRAILYADRVTGSMQRAMDETERRRNKQLAFNAEHGLTPKGIHKSVADIMEGAVLYGPAKGKKRKVAEGKNRYDDSAPGGVDTLKRLASQIAVLEEQMYKHARNLEFEEAAALRDRIHALQQRELKAV